METGNKRYVLLVVIFLVIVLATLALYIFVRPAVKDEKIFVSNISENQAVISWVTNSPVREWVRVTEKNTNAPRILKDSKENSLHYVTASNLNPNTTYEYKIYQNFKETDSGTFTTSPKMLGAKVSKTVSGQILSADKKTPAAGTTVYLQLFEGARQSTLLSTVTDKDGKWSANILGARTADLKNEFKIASRSAVLVIAEAGAGGRYHARFALDNKIQSLPNIILKGSQK